MAFDAGTAALGIETPWEDVIRSQAVGDWSLYALIKAVIAAESGWNPGAINPSDPSYGLMQVTPATARLYAPAITPDDLLDPVTNLVIGSAHLRDLLARYWTPDALAVYNSGAARKNAQNQYVSSQGSTGVQSYVDSVLTYQSWYLNRLPAQVPDPLLEPWWAEPGADPPADLADLGAGAGLGLVLVAAALALSQ